MEENRAGYTLEREAKKLWRSVSSGPSKNRIKIDFEVYEKLLKLFQVGDFFYTVFDVERGEIEPVKGRIENVLGLSPQEFTSDDLFKIIHPEHSEYYLEIHRKMIHFYRHLSLEEYFRYKAQYDFKFRHTDGHYKWVLMQSLVCETDLQGQVLKTFVTFTDISKFKKTGRPTLSFVGLEGHPTIESKIDLPPHEDSEPECVLSEREIQILSQLRAHKASREIAEELNISYHTVVSHRKNILSKTKSKNSMEAVLKALDYGWL